MPTDEEALTGGRWVPGPNGVRRWVEDQPKTRPRVWADTNEILQAAKDSPKKRTQALGVKIRGLLNDLAKALNDDIADRKAREAAQEADRERKERIAELEAEIRKLKGQRPKQVKAAAAKPVAAQETQLCEQCSRRFASVQALRMHERRAHEGFDPMAVHGAQEAS